MLDTTRLDATALADLVRKKEVTPLELVDAAIARIEAHDPKLNAVITRRFERARDEAKRPVDTKAPFCGVPFLHKDILAMQKGERYTSGSAMLRDYVATEDFELTVRHRKAGLISLGRTNVPEFGFTPTTESRHLGRCHNPWKLGVTPGGSSGGSAAAVASRMVPMAHGNDGGGSIRIPASCCGIFGLKPTRGRNPLGPAVGDIMSGFVVEHALTISVRDSAALLDATQGADLGAPYVAPPLARPHAEEARTRPGKLRIAVATQTILDSPLHPDCAAMLEDTRGLLRELGHEVVDSEPAVEGAMVLQTFMAVWAAGAEATIDGMSMILGRAPERHEIESLSWALHAMGKQVTGGQYLLAITYLQQVARQLARWMEPFDLILTPTLAEPPVAHGTIDPTAENGIGAFMRAAEFAPYTALANVTGQPAMSVPLFWNADGLPVGSHFVGKFGDEATLFRLAAQLEQARPWADRRPPISS
jgi:amidase